MKKRITKKDIARVEKSLAEARAQKDIKRIVFCEATLKIYRKEVKA